MGIAATWFYSIHVSFSEICRFRGSSSNNIYLLHGDYLYRKAFDSVLQHYLSAALLLGYVRNPTVKPITPFEHLMASLRNGETVVITGCSTCDRSLSIIDYSWYVAWLGCARMHSFGYHKDDKDKAEAKFADVSNSSMQVLGCYRE